VRGAFGFASVRLSCSAASTFCLTSGSAVGCCGSCGAGARSCAVTCGAAISRGRFDCQSATPTAANPAIASAGTHGRRTQASQPPRAGAPSSAASASAFAAGSRNRSRSGCSAARASKSTWSSSAASKSACCSSGVSVPVAYPPSSFWTSSRLISWAAPNFRPWRPADSCGSDGPRCKSC
jgi:hypothetical protein